MNTPITWKRRGAQRTTHAFRDAELERFDLAMPLGECGMFKVADLVEDHHAAKCVKCENAVRRLDLQQRQAALKTRLGGPVNRPGRPGRQPLRSAA